MKFILVLVATISLLSHAVFAESNGEILDELRSLHRKVDRLLDRDDRPGRNGFITTKVDLDCLGTILKNYNGYLYENSLIEFASACRTQLEVDNCQKVASSPDGACFAAVLKAYTGYKYESTIKSFQEACVEVSYRCY